MMDFRKIAKATAVIQFETDDAKRYVDKCDEFDLDPSWLGKFWTTAKDNSKENIGNTEFKLCGLRKRNGAWMLVIQLPAWDNIYTLYSLREFFSQCKLL